MNSKKLKFSYFQLTFGQEEAYKHPEITYQRLKKFGYDAINAHPLLWHMHFRDSNSLTPGFGTVDFKSVIRAIKKIDYDGYCTIESAPMIPDADTACKMGIDYLKMVEKIVEIQTDNTFPNGYEII